MTGYELDDVDGCDDEHGIAGHEPPLPDDHVEVFPLFAEALDPDSAVTVAEVEEQWRQIREEGGL